MENLQERHAGTFAEIRNHDADRAADQSGAGDREASEHQVNDGDKRQKQMSFVAQERQGFRQLFPRHATQTEPLCFQMDADPDADEVQRCRDDGNKHQCPVRYANCLADEESGAAHDWRHDLAAGGGGSLDRAGELWLIAERFHHRDSKGTGGDRVGHGGAGYRTLQR